MKQEMLATALVLERQMYQALSETASLTVDLSEAVGRQDSESVRLFLRMRQEQIDHLVEHDGAIRRALSETASLTVDLSEAVGRQDSESVRLFLRMRQEQIDHLVEHDGAIRRLCDELTQERDRLRMRELLEGKAQEIAPEEEPLFQQVTQNLAVLARVRQADASVNRKLCRQDSFYGT